MKASKVAKKVLVGAAVAAAIGGASAVSALAGAPVAHAYTSSDIQYGLCIEGHGYTPYGGLAYESRMGRAVAHDLQAGYAAQYEENVIYSNTDNSVSRSDAYWAVACANVYL